MALPTFTMRQLLEAGVHFGHITRLWNPKMKPYIFTKRSDVHILNLQLTVPLLRRALEAVRNTVSNKGRVLFVGTKRQVSTHLKDAAKKCGQYYINYRWLGGTLTNWKTVSQSIARLKKLEAQIANGEDKAYTKKEQLAFARNHQKLDLSLGGIKDMGGLPDIIVVIDSNKESIAIQEARKLKIPVVAVLDSNSDPDGIDYPIPGNDDAARAIELYCHLFSAAVLDGLQAEMRAAGIDVGASLDPSASDQNTDETLFKDEDSPAQTEEPSPSVAV